MAVPVAALAKIAAAVLSDEDTRKRFGWIVAAICSPLILTLALICSLLSGSAEHNIGDGCYAHIGLAQNTRVRSLDAIPFTRSLRFDLELSLIHI